MRRLSGICDIHILKIGIRGVRSMPSGFNLEITATCRRYDGLQLLLRALNAQTYSTAIQKVSLFPAPLSLTPVPQASHSVFTTNSVSRECMIQTPTDRWWTSFFAWPSLPACSSHQLRKISIERYIAYQTVPCRWGRGAPRNSPTFDVYTIWTRSLNCKRL